MIFTQGQKLQSDIELPTGIDDSESACDLPPAYDALSIHQSTSHTAIRNPSSTFRGPVAGSSSDSPDSIPARSNPTGLYSDQPLPPRPASLDNAPTSPKKDNSVLAQRHRARKNTSWFSLLPFVSSFSAKRARQSVLSVVSDLVVPPSRAGNEEQKNVHEVFASIAETCAEHRLPLSTILQETYIADHTPMYWAIVNYRQELLVALLVHSRPLSIQTISDIRRACLASSSQALFHALRVCHPPFHNTSGIQVQNVRTASDNLLLGNRPLDEIHITQTTEQAFVVFFDIPLWQRRIKAIGQVGIEFIVSSRMWSVTFFSTDPSSSNVTSGKSRKATNAWHVMVSLLESSSPTYFDSQLVVDVPSPSSSLPNTTIPSPASIRLRCGERKLGRRTNPGESPQSLETPTTKPDKWSEHGVGYTNAIVSPLGEGLASRLLDDHSPYLFPDGTLRGRLEARLVKSESSRHCIVC